MNTAGMRRFAISASCAALSCLAGQSAHTSEICGFASYGGGYQPREIKALGELPVPIQHVVRQRVFARVGPKFIDDISFERGEIVDVNELHRVYPESNKFKWRVPTYSLMFQLRLRGPGLFRAYLCLDEKGAAIQELTLPHWARQQNPTPPLSLPEATEVARRNGAQVSEASSELKYCPDTDTLEWVFQWKTWDDGLYFGGKRLYVVGPNQVHWEPWWAIR